MLTVTVDSSCQSSIDPNATDARLVHELVISSRLTCLLLLLLLHLAQHGSHRHHIVLVLLMLLLLLSSWEAVVAVVDGRVIEGLLMCRRGRGAGGKSGLLVRVGLEHIHLVVLTARHGLVGSVGGGAKVAGGVVGAGIVVVGWIDFGHDHE